MVVGRDLPDIERQKFARFLLEAFVYLPKMPNNL